MQQPFDSSPGNFQLHPKTATASTGMYGDLHALATGPTEALAAQKNGSASSLIGWGMCPEGIEQNPVVYDAMSEWAFRRVPPAFSLTAAGRGHLSGWHISKGIVLHFDCQCGRFHFCGVEASDGNLCGSLRPLQRVSPGKVLLPTASYTSANV